MKNDQIIKVENVTKVFKLPHEKLSTVKQHFVNVFNPKTYEKFKALDEVSFEVKKGEFFGIIGANGSGKSTLLKILAGIYQPTSGSVSINGSLSPFIELGVGFNPELTARENVFLNAAILGLTKKETEEKFDDIIKFAELENFIDQKLKNFSSGMQVRLGFSIAIQAHTDILLVDEVLAVGDSGFQQKCFDVFYQLKREGKTIVFVSHDLTAVNDFCDRVLIMENGKNMFIGEASKATLEYMKLTTLESESKLSSNKDRSKEALIEKVICKDNLGDAKNVFNVGDDILVDVKLKKNKFEVLNFGVAIYKSDGTYCFGINTLIDRVKVPQNLTFFKINFNKTNLLPGSYYLIVAVFGKTDKQILDFLDKAAYFKIHSEKKLGEGLIEMNHSWLLPNE